ncbi:hypothetical protein [Caballeronia sp. GAWG2-1]|uniref:hypothetical protein n=1 Tax=Caballeronia sp. GAWG2-1 TaxID=2921744 RepID=UPI002028909F|nr:hypothetical protein [Caballeronia sp. GAWG2-1]
MGNGVQEAEILGKLVEGKGVLGVVGMQARLAPEVAYLRQLISDGFVGNVLSTTVIARGSGWGGMVENKSTSSYLLDSRNGATMLTIPTGHMLASLGYVFGDIEQVSAIVCNRRSEAVVGNTGES